MPLVQLTEEQLEQVLQPVEGAQMLSLLQPEEKAQVVTVAQPEDTAQMSSVHPAVVQAATVVNQPEADQSLSVATPVGSQMTGAQPVNTAQVTQVVNR